MKDKFIHIGIPWIFGALFLAPLITYMIYFSRGVPMSFLDFWRTDFWGKLYQQSVYWFLGVLLLMFVVLAWVYEDERSTARAPRRIGPARPAKFLRRFIALTAVRLSDHQPVVQSRCLVAQLFSACTNRCACRSTSGILLWASMPIDAAGSLADGYKPEHRSMGLGLCAVRAWLTSLIAGAWLTRPTPHCRSKSERRCSTTLFCFTALIAGVALFQRKVNSAGAVWSSLAANSYGIYYVHPLILYPLAYVFVGLSLPLIIKAPALIGLAILLSWGVSALLLKRLPVLRAMF